MREEWSVNLIILLVIGNDKQGVACFMLYGYKYPVSAEARGEALIDLFNVIDYATNT